MALYDLVSFRHRLTQALQVSEAVNKLIELQNSIANIKSQVPVLNDENKEYINSLINHYEQVIKLAQQPELEFKGHIDKVNEEIGRITHRLFANNYELEERYGDANFVRNHRRIYVNADVEDIIKQRILLHTSWRYPALEIGCRDGEWTQFLVAADPLYIMDRHSEFLESTSSKFPEAYQRRLRNYPLINHNLSALPKDQFAFVFSWGYFNYVSLDTMKQYLKQIFGLLRPGGIFMFSYNDGDTPSGAGMAENFSQTYMPKSMLIPLSESIGFDVGQNFDYDANVSWLELKRPGELQTVKSHQVLGEIRLINT
ncbi:AdoMet_MTases domain containing protein [uncultured Caudovirales phage]|uniref:AdoMet_MTases domain containing protein n=1 Tax=uncultured Caudovirales phage TaxID=2100421 RepID=A0A6J5L3B4_9CAUD|nr:AdoMet_MTases domain containing protein [uncultured Caudovirales phage]